MKIIACQSPADLKASEIASANAIVMDGETYQNIGCVMPGAANIIVSPDWEGDTPSGWFVFSHMGDAIRLASSAGMEMMLVVGKDIRRVAINAYGAEAR